MGSRLWWPPAEITNGRRREWDAFEGLDAVDHAFQIATVHAHDRGLPLRERHGPRTRCSREEN
jgi:hypothetical protein